MPAEETQEGKIAENNTKKGQGEKEQGLGWHHFKKPVRGKVRSRDKRLEEMRKAKAQMEAGRCQSQRKRKEQQEAEGAKGGKMMQRSPAWAGGQGTGHFFPLPPCICTPKYPPSPCLKVQVAEAGGGLGVNYA